MEEKVFFDGELGKVCGVIHKVDSTSEVVIIVHGFSSTKDTGAIQISEKLNAIGLNAIRIDLDNQGESELDFLEGVSIPNYIKQVEATIKYCESLGYREISLIGGSFGGAVVFGVAMLHHEIKRVVFRAPVVDYQKHLIRRFGEEKMKEFLDSGKILYKRPKTGEEFWFNADSYTTAKDFSMYDHAKEVKCPVFFIQGDNDGSVDWTLPNEIVGFFPNARVHIIKGGDHSLGVEGDYTEQYRVLCDFFKEEI